MKPTVLCYGGICVDNIIHVPYLPTPGVATTPTHQQFQIGGGATQTAVWLANWDIPVTLTGNAIGDDFYAGQIMSWLNAYQTFDRSNIQRLSTVDTPYTRAIVPPNGDRYLIEFGYDAVPMCDANDVNLDGINIVTVNYYYNNPERESQHLAKRAYEQGITVIASDILDDDNPFFGTSSILINSRAVMAKMLPDTDHRQYTIDLQAKHGGIVIMTDGGNSVWVVDQKGKTFSVDIPQVEVYDTTGAGDAFRAGIVYGELNNYSLEDSVKLAVAAGTLQVERDASSSTPASFKEALALANQITINQ